MVLIASWWTVHKVGGSLPCLDSHICEFVSESFLKGQIFSLSTPQWLLWFIQSCQSCFNDFDNFIPCVHQLVRRPSTTPLLWEFYLHRGSHSLGAVIVGILPISPFSKISHDSKNSWSWYIPSLPASLLSLPLFVPLFHYAPIIPSPSGSKIFPIMTTIMIMAFPCDLDAKLHHVYTICIGWERCFLQWWRI